MPDRIWLVFGGIDNGDSEDFSVLYKRPYFATFDEQEAKDYSERLEAELSGPDGTYNCWVEWYSVKIGVDRYPGDV